MENIRFYIDQQNDPKRNAKFRLRVLDRIDSKRVEVKAIYFETRKAAERFKKHFREVVSAITSKKVEKDADN